MTNFGLFAGGLLFGEVPREPSIDLEAPSSIQSAMGQGLVRGHYHSEVDDLLGPITYTWTATAR